jgi:hypothetical protein
MTTTAAIEEKVRTVWNSSQRDWIDRQGDHQRGDHEEQPGQQPPERGRATGPPQQGEAGPAR